MSFAMLCTHCGAQSGPSVGVCPFCKKAFAEGGGSKKPPTRRMVEKAFAEGQLEKALELLEPLRKDHPELETDPGYLLVETQIFFESEGPSGRMRSNLAKALANAPGDRTLQDYAELLEARRLLSDGRIDEGERRVKAILQRNPDHAHATFVLGTHYFWRTNQHALAARYLEKCVAVRPNFLRAWGCLGALYSAMGQPSLAQRAFEQCLRLESQPAMRRFFEERLEALRRGDLAKAG